MGVLDSLNRIETNARSIISYGLLADKLRRWTRNKAEMILVNVHSGKSDKGNYNSRGSKGCITIHPDDAAAFLVILHGI